MFDEGTNVITAELAAGITPEEFADGPVSYLGSPPESQEHAA